MRALYCFVYETLAYAGWGIAWGCIALIALALFGALAGCEVRTLRVERMDGTIATYTRTSLGVESSTEDVSVSKDGSDFTLDVGATGSKTDAALAIEAFGIGFKAGQNQGSNQ